MQPKYYKIIIAILIILLIGAAYFLFKASRDTVDMSDYFKTQKDSIQKVLVVVKDTADKKEKLYIAKIDSLEKIQKQVILRMTILGNANVKKVRELPTDKAIWYFGNKVIVENGYPKKVINEPDTLIEITTGQLSEANALFEENDNLYYIKDTLEEQLDITYGLLNESKTVLNAKNIEISVLNEFSKVKDNIILSDKETLLGIKKRHRIEMFCNTLGSAIVGFVLGKIF